MQCATPGSLHRERFRAFCSPCVLRKMLQCITGLSYARCHLLPWLPPARSELPCHLMFVYSGSRTVFKLTHLTLFSPLSFIVGDKKDMKDRDRLEDLDVNGGKY